jgi:hypothetical protein
MKISIYIKIKLEKSETWVWKELSHFYTLSGNEVLFGS